ncbi:MAG: DUF1573 domain-containing protein [Desulfobacterales bacterium]|nr:DUF1573 domain-containing protein [Desulfobacterales bacterium]
MMRIFRAILLGFLVLLVCAGLTQAEKAKKAAPVIEVETPIYEFDQVSQGDVVKHDFRVFNRGSAPLEIKKVKPG